MQGLEQLIADRATASPHSAYLEDARSERVISYAGLAAALAAWRGVYSGLGIPRGSAVLVDLDDPLAFAAAHLAAVASGMRSIPVDPDSPAATLHTLSRLIGGVSLTVSNRDERAVLPQAATARVRLATGLPLDIRPSEEDHPRSRRRGPGGSTVLFTSGSTGEPKGVELAEEQLLFVARAVARHNGLSDADRGYNPLPLFHVNAQVIGLLATLVSGSTLVLDRRFHRTGFWELLDDRRITWLNAVPAILAVLARGGDIRLPATLRFVRSASAPLPEAVRDALGGIPLVVSYGMTEAASQITATPLGEPSPAGSVGRPVATQLQARDDAGVVLPTGEIGELWIRGEGVIGGYLAGRASDRFDVEGWLSTGDLGRMDENGFVYLVGRSDDVINRGGEKVYPSEVEDALLLDERVREAVVVGRPDEILGSVPVAYVMLVDGQEETPDLLNELTTVCERELARFKRPVQISVVADVPRAPTGKVQRSRMRSHLR